MPAREPTPGERLALSDAQAQGGPDQPVEGITERTDHLNPDSARDPKRDPERFGAGGERQGMVGPVGYFEGEGNEGPFAPLGGDPTKSAADVGPNEQGGTASGAPDTGGRP